MKRARKYKSSDSGISEIIVNKFWQAASSADRSIVARPSILREPDHIWQMARWISAELRQRIADRAKLLCEYCPIAEANTFYGYEVEHIISLKQGGSSEPDNLAYACTLWVRVSSCETCNQSDLSVHTELSVSHLLPRTVLNTV